MSLKVRVLSSGSSGNAALYSAGACHVLIDCGLSARTLTGMLRRAGVEPESLSGIFVTHEHTDHIQGLPVFLRRLRVPLFVAPESYDTEAFRGVDAKVEPLVPDVPVTLGPLTVTPFPLPHDAACCYGYVLQAGGVKAVQVTDLGTPTPQVMTHMKGAHCMLVEFNHDVDRLMNGAYPMPIKLRVRSDLGHLSNEQGARLLQTSANGETQAVFLMHLSKQNNLPALAALAAREALKGTSVKVVVSEHLAPAPPWEG
jgi:phosphoribosyl 1,2-cyclic phosphodiesterase